MSAPEDIERVSGLETEPEPELKRNSTIDNEKDQGVKGALERGNPPAASDAPMGVLSKTLSRIRTKDSFDPGPPPDGGLRAWLVVAAGHLVIFNVWGSINSFGLFQNYYVDVMGIGGPSSVAWIGTTQVFVLFGMGTFTGRGLDAGYFQVQFICGSILYVVGMFLLSLCDKYWQIFLAQTLCVGCGYGLVFVPTIALVSTYFYKNRSTALGIVVTGSATGGLVFPAIAERMLPRAGFAWTVRTMAFVELTLAIISCLVLRPRLPPRKSGPLVEWSAFREAPYLLYVIGGFLYFWSIYVGFFFIGTFGTNVLGTSQSTSINLLLVLNGVGVPGRTIPPYLAQRWIGPLNLMIPLVAVAGIVLYSWIAVSSVTGLWIFAIMYGLAVAGPQALFPVVLTSLTHDPKRIGVRTGMAFSIMGVAVLTGPPIAGALLQRDGGNFLGLQLFSATSMMASSIVLLCTRSTIVGWKAAKL